MVWPYAYAPNSYPDLIEEGLQPHKVKEVWLWVPEQPNLKLDITDTYEIKEKAICCHRTQIEDWMDSPDGYEEAQNGMMKFTRDLTLKAAEGTEFKYAEAFARVMVPPRL